MDGEHDRIDTSAFPAPDGPGSGSTAIADPMRPGFGPVPGVPVSRPAAGYPGAAGWATGGIPPMAAMRPMPAVAVSAEMGGRRSPNRTVAISVGAAAIGLVVVIVLGLLRNGAVEDRNIGQIALDGFAAIWDLVLKVVGVFG